VDCVKQFRISFTEVVGDFDSISIPDDYISSHPDLNAMKMTKTSADLGYLGQSVDSISPSPDVFCDSALKAAGDGDLSERALSSPFCRAAAKLRITTRCVKGRGSCN
jgi:hypothetical protein